LDGLHGHLIFREVVVVGDRSAMLLLLAVRQKPRDGIQTVEYKVQKTFGCVPFCAEVIRPLHLEVTVPPENKVKMLLGHIPGDSPEEDLLAVLEEGSLGARGQVAVPGEAPLNPGHTRLGVVLVIGEVGCRWSGPLCHHVVRVALLDVVRVALLDVVKVALLDVVSDCERLAVRVGNC